MRARGRRDLVDRQAAAHGAVKCFTEAMPHRLAATVRRVCAYRPSRRRVARFRVAERRRRADFAIRGKTPILAPTGAAPGNETEDAFYSRRNPEVTLAPAQTGLTGARSEFPIPLRADARCRNIC